MSDYKEANPNDGYEAFREKFTEIFAANQEAGPIFETDLYERLGSEGEVAVWNCWHTSLPEAARQHYNCWTCKAFFQRYANLVVVDIDGAIRSAFLPPLEQTPELFVEASKYLNHLVSKCKITGVYHPTERTVLGTPKSLKGWSHFSVIFAKSDTTFVLKGNAHQYASIMKKFMDDLREVSEMSWKNVQLLLDAGKFADHKLIDQIKWTLEIHNWVEVNKKMDGFNPLLWVKLVNAPIGWVNFKNKSVGELIFEAAENADVAYMKFLSMTDPLVYQRAQKEASDNQLRVAMATVDQLGVTQSLYRRPARLDEIRYLWKSEVAEVSEEAVNKEESPANPFGKMLEVKLEKSTVSPALIDAVAIPFSKFWLHVLPKAKSLRIQPLSTSRIGISSFGRNHITAHGFMTAVYPDAPPVFKHDLVEDRYPVNEWTFSEPAEPRVWMNEDKVGQWLDVVGITRSCEEIREPFDFLSEKKQYGFFVVKGLGITETTQAALFPSMLIPELHGIRAAIENFSVNANIEHSETRGDEAVGFATLVPAIIEVTLDSGTALYRIVN